MPTMRSSLPPSCVASCAEPASKWCAAIGRAARTGLPRCAGLPVWRLPDRPSLPGELAVGDPVRSGGLNAETFEFVVLVAFEVALEPGPPSRVAVAPRRPTVHSAVTGSGSWPGGPWGPDTHPLQFLRPPTAPLGVATNEFSGRNTQWLTKWGSTN